MVQDRGFAVYVETSQELLGASRPSWKVAAGLLMPSASALALVATTLDALASMDQDSLR